MTTGLLYSVSIPLLIAFSIGIQLVSVPFFLWARRTDHKEREKQGSAG